MPLTDLSRVTEVLAETLRLNITLRIDPGLAGLLNVTTLPPERVTGEMNTINLYCYHLSEEPQYRNLSGNLSDGAPVATKPMALVLYYILTTHHEVQSLFDSLTQQRLMGYALKTLHDFALIDDASTINGTPLLPSDLRGRDNALEIALRPVRPEESVAFWSSEDQATTRLSAYPEVRYAFLEPDPPTRLPGLVLSLGTFLVAFASPQLTGSRSQLAFTLPALAGGGAQTIEAAPARVGPPIPAIPASNRLTLLGSNLTVGQRREIRLSSARWRVRLSAVERVTVDPALPQNAAAGWTVSEAADRIEVTMGSALTVDLPPGPPVTLPVEPGLYAASVHTVKDAAVVLGRLKEITDTSNTTAFTVIPRVAGAAVVNLAERRIRIDLDPSVDLTPPAGPGLPGALDILFVVAGEAYRRHDPTSGATFDIGDFQPSGSTIEFRARFDPAAAGTYPVRVIVEGADSQPFWLELP